jgi:serine phosphatase RsbU (regulator of sigma subunit)/anti-sigma regulatory factor (Ser/Thr protein kinase)
MKLFLVVIFLILIFFPFLLLNGQSSVYSISPDVNEYPLGNNIDIFEDKDGYLDFNDITSPEISKQFIPSSQDEPGFGFTSSVFWIRLTVENPEDRSIDWLLEIAYPPLDFISLYVPDNKNYIIKKTGDRFPFATREIKHRNFIFPMHEDPLSIKTYYLRIQSNSSMNFPLNFYMKDSFISKIDSEQLLLGIYFGSVIIMIIYNIFLYLGFREKSFIYLILFIISWGFAQFAINGLAFQYLWSDWIWWANKNVPFFIFATLAASTQFCRSLLKTDVNIPLWDKILKYEIIIFLGGMIVSLIADYSISIRTAAAVAIFDILSIGIVSSISIKYSRSAIFFLSAWGLFFLGALLLALKSFGILPGNFITTWGVQIGSFALLILLSIAVQDRIETEKKEKLSAQQASIKSQQKMVDSLRESERLLEKRVEERTDELNKINILLIDSATELANINQIAEKASASLHLEDVLQYICEELVKIFDVQSAGIALLNDQKTKLKIAAFHSINEREENISGTELLLADYEASLLVIETKQPLAVPDAQNDPRTRSIHDFLKRNEADSILIIPILSKNEVIGTIGMPFISPDYEFDKNKIELARSIAFHIASSVENARLYAKTEKALDIAERDLEIGKQIQSGFFPESLPEINGWEFAAYFKAARQVSGDFYDVFQLDNSKLMVIVIADVCDKGVGAALFMVLFRSLIRSFSEMRLNIGNIPEESSNIISSINNYITGTHGNSNMFASIFYGVLVPETGELYYINSGHEAPLLINFDGKIKQRLLPTGPVVGLMPDMRFGVENIKLNDSDILFAYTDGTTDARNQDMLLFSESSILDSVSNQWTSAFSMLFSLNSELERFIGNHSQYDDITQIAVRKKAKNEIEQHSICRTAEMKNLKELRSFVEQTALHKKLSKEVVSDFKLAAEEICSNIINYGYKSASPGNINLFFSFNDKKAILRIVDSGEYFSPWEIETPDLRASWEEREIGGLGLHFIKELFDNVHYSKLPDNYNQLVLEKIL